MRRSATAILALCLLGTACGSSGNESVAADDASAVTVAGADSAIASEGDDRPEGEEDGTSLVSVAVDVPEGVELAGNAVVALEDVTGNDVGAVEIARVELPASELVAQNLQVDVFLPLPLDGSLDITATVHIDVDESGSFSPGDWISPELAPVTGGTSSSVTVIMVQI